MALTDLIAIDRESLCFVAEETAYATEVKPGANDQVLIAGEGSVRQQIGFIADQQRRNTFSELKRYAGRFNPGEFSLPMYVKPSGSAGTAPDGGALLKALFGREVVTGGTSVEYFLQRVTDTLPSLTIWLKTAHFLYRCLGTIVQSGRFPLRANNSDESLSRVELAAVFAELRWTGTDEANETIGGTPQATLVVKNAKKFTVGSYIIVGGDDNGGSGYQVTNVDVGTNTLTLSPSIANVNTDDLVEPWVPTGSETGDPVHGRLGTATLGGATLPLLGGEIVLENNVKVLNEEKNGLDFANRFVRASKRRVRVTAEIYFDAESSRWFYDAPNQVRGDLVFPWGTVAGKKFTLTAKNVELDAPQISGAEEKIMRLEGQAFASASLDNELAGLFD